MDSLLLGCIDVAAVIIAFFRLPAVEPYAADASHNRAKSLGWQLLAARLNGSHLRACFAIASILLECAVGDLRQEVFPIGLEAGASLFER
ncbi:hypothetical protein [Bradyrhizobium sp.]|jgi:hypothetical protein|uniref:hypothetical protein n=1 Tax=Bradyrhizobium sp. TaxID=376 RepID=UPI003C19FB59